MNLADLMQTLQTTIDSDAPTTEKEAAELAGALTEPLQELTAWVAELQDLLGDVENNAADLPDSDELDATHADLVDACTSLRDQLTAAVHAPAGT